MKQRHSIALALVVAVLAGVVWWAIARGSGEPVYQGKRLSYWLQGLDYSRQGRLNIPMRDANRAIRAAGTNAFPTLFRMLRSTDSPAKLRFMKLVGKQHVVNIDFNTAESRHRQAAAAFYALGPRALATIPDLIKLYDENPSESSQIEIIQIFGSMGTAAKDALPLINRAMSGTNASLQAAASNSIQMISPGRNTYNPVDESLLSRLNDYKTWQQAEGAKMIYSENFGSTTRFASVIPTIVSLLKQSRPNSYWLTFALEALNPDIAAKFITNAVEAPEPAPPPSDPGVLGNSRLLAVSKWTGTIASDPNHWIRARLLVYEPPHLANHLGDWWGDAPIEIELQDSNIGIGIAPTVVYFDGNGCLQFQLFDSKGAIVPPLSGEPNTDAPPQCLIIPFDGTVRFRADAALPATRTRPDGLTLRLGTSVWRIPSGDTNAYVLSGTFTPAGKHTNELDYHIWSGSIPLPEVKIIAAKR